MTPELTALTLAALLWIVQFMIYLAAGHGKLDVQQAMGPRDEPVARPGVVGRMHRALANYSEGLPLFAIAVLVLTLSEQGTAFTAACAWIYLAARVLYIPAYALGWMPWRTVIWMLSLFATLAMLVSALV
ncbi:MAG: MAPEG family protein [Marinibacterium sp.]|nr:MAPEG family protein [Marinibacterium sp.]